MLLAHAYCCISNVLTVAKCVLLYCLQHPYKPGTHMRNRKPYNSHVSWVALV